MDNNLKTNSHNLKLLAVAALLILTPLVSNPLRLTYLYFIVNILIIAVGADAGLLSFLLQSAANKKINPANISCKDNENVDVVARTKNQISVSPDHLHHQPTSKNSDRIVQKCSSDEAFDAVPEAVRIEKSSPLSPSIFFIGESVEDGKGELEGGDAGAEELFEKAEMFIGNFYKQLKMQREESWKMLHDPSHKAS